MLLELDHVGKSYPSAAGGADLKILSDICLGVDVGESVSIMGPSGSGKSTLLNIMGAIDRPTSGSVSLSGKPMASMSDSELSKARNREIGFVFQQHYLLPQCTLLENVLVPTLADKGGTADRNEITRAMSLLKRVGLEDRMNNVPGRLSVGECQRAAVARALINAPRLLLADEPTGSLDAASAEDVAKLLVEIGSQEQMALIVVTHSSALAARMKRRFLLAAGILQES